MTFAALGEIADIVQGGRHGLSGLQFVPSGYPAFGAGGLNGYLESYEFDEDAVILSSIGARCGKCFFATGRWSSLANTQVIRPNPKLADARFLWFQLNDEARWPRSGTGQPFIKPSDVKSHRVMLPEVSEQRRIAGRLDQADRLVRTRRYALELTDSFLPAAFLELFGGQDPALSPWPAAPLGEHLEAIEGGVNFNPVGENDPASDWRVLKVSAVSWSDFLAEESKPISPSESFSEKLIVQHGDLIMSRANTVELVGAVARVRTPPGKVLLPDKLWRLKFHAASQLLPDYLLYALRSRVVRREIEIRATGTSGSMKNISKEDVRELRLPLPPLQLQQRFAALVERVERLRAVQREAVRQAEHLFASLLDRAFSG